MFVVRTSSSVGLQNGCSGMDLPTNPGNSGTVSPA